MAVPSPLRRAWLYVPALRREWYTQLPQLKTDVLVFDLEDSIAQCHKEEARVCLNEELPKVRSTISQECFIRINAADTEEFEADLELLQEHHDQVTGVVLPKVASARDFKRIESLRLRASFEIVPIIETLDGETHLENILSASSRIRTVQWGESADYSTDYGYFPKPFNAETDYLALDFACRTLKVCKRHRKEILDGLYLDYQDNEGLKKRCHWAMTMGFSGKVAIHPQQIPVIQESFTPNREYWNYAQEIVQTYEAKIETGIVPFKNSYIHRPFYLNAKKFLKRYRNFFKESS